MEADPPSPPPQPSKDFKQAGAVPFKREIQPGIPRTASSSSSIPAHLRPPPAGSSIFSSFSGALTPRSCRTRSSPCPSSSSSSSSPSFSRLPQRIPILLGCLPFHSLRRRPRSRCRDNSRSNTDNTTRSSISIRGRPFDTVFEIGSPVRLCASPLSPLTGAGDSPLLVGRSLSAVGAGDSPRFVRVSPCLFSSFRESPVSYYDAEQTTSFRNDLDWATYGLF